MIKTISLETYNELRAKIDLFEKWVDTKRGRNGWASYKPEEVPNGLYNPTNEEKALVETYEFVNNPPAKYFCYIRRIAESRIIEATGFMGNIIGNGFLGASYETPAYGCFPSKRYPVRFRGINGKEYYGTYYASSGDYARVKMVVDKPKRTSKVAI